jgi:hypothetical protein
LTVFFNKELYLFIDNPKKHFAHEMHIAKELSSLLKSENINCVTTDDKMQLRLRYYGIHKCTEHTLTEININSKRQFNVTIGYKNNTLYKAYVTNLNK